VVFLVKIVAFPPQPIGFTDSEELPAVGVVLRVNTPPHMVVGLPVVDPQDDKVDAAVMHGMDMPSIE